MSLFAFLRVLKARFMVIVWVVMICAGIGYIVGAWMPDIYTTSATVQVNPIRINPLTNSMEPSTRTPEFLGRQAAILRSRTVALGLVSQLERDHPDLVAPYRDKWIEDTGSGLDHRVSFQVWFADRLLDRMQIGQNALESTLQVTVRVDDPQKAAIFANGFAQSYVQFVSKRHRLTAEKNALGFSSETADLENSVAEARAALTKFQQENGIVAIGAQQLESAEMELASLTTRLSEARADLSEARSRYEQARLADGDELMTLPLSSGNLPGRAAQGRLATITTQMERLNARYGPRHPDYLELQEERERQLLVVFNSIADQMDYKKRRVDRLARDVDQQKQTVVGLHQTRQQLEVLQNDLTNNREAYDLVASRSLQQELQSRVELVDIYLLTPAANAAPPVLPRHVIVVVVALVFGMIFGVALAVVLELVEGRLRAPAMLSYVTRAPVLASVPVTAGRKQIGWAG